MHFYSQEAVPPFQHGPSRTEPPTQTPICAPFRFTLRLLPRSLALIFPFVLAFKNALPCVPMRAFRCIDTQCNRDSDREREREQARRRERESVWLASSNFLRLGLSSWPNAKSIEFHGYYWPQSSGRAQFWQRLLMMLLLLLAALVIIVVALVVVLVAAAAAAVFCVSHLNLLNYILQTLTAAV